MDYKERFVIEYLELERRFLRLREMIFKYKQGTLDFKPTCPIEVLNRQLNIMADYIEVLEDRAKIENIEL